MVKGEFWKRADNEHHRKIVYSETFATAAIKMAQTVILLSNKYYVIVVCRPTSRILTVTATFDCPRIIILDQNAILELSKGFYYSSIMS